MKKERTLKITVKRVLVSVMTLAIIITTTLSNGVVASARPGDGEGGPGQNGSHQSETAISISVDQESVFIGESIMKIIYLVLE